MPILNNLKQVKYLLAFIGVAFIAFDISYIFMSILPGSRDNMCMMGANLTPVNIAFAGVLSLLIGVLFAGFIKLFAMNMVKQKVTLTSLSGLGFFVGIMSVICPVCTLPVVFLFGTTIWVDFVSNHDILLKIVSLMMMAGSLCLLNRQLNNTCLFCTAESCKN